jgi:hypothetical protein
MEESNFRAACLRLLKKLFTHFSTVEVPFTYSDVAELRSDGTWYYGCQQTIDWHTLFTNHYDYILALKEYKKLKASLTPDMTGYYGNKLLDLDDFYLVYHWCVDVCRELHRRCGNVFAFNLIRAKSLCLSLERFLQGSHFICEENCIIQNALRRRCLDLKERRSNY